MNILEETLRDLGHALEGDLSGTQLAGIQDTIHNYAIAAAVAGAAGPFRGESGGVVLT